MEILHEIASFIQENVADTLGLPYGKVKVIRRNRNLRDGDFVIPFACIKHANPTPGKRDDTPTTTVPRSSPPGPIQTTPETTDFSDQFFKTLGETRESAEKEWIEVQRCFRGKDGNLHVALNRSATLQYFLRIGQCLQAPQKKRKKILLNIADACTQVDELMEVGNLRAILIGQHLENMMENNGYACARLLHTIPDSWKYICSLFNVRTDEGATTTRDRDRCSRLISELEKSEYRIIETGERCSDANKEDDAQRPDEPVLTLNLKKYMTDKNLPVGKDGFDKNIDKITLPHGNITNQLCSLVSFPEYKNESADLCMHIVGRPQSFQQQQVQLLWHMIPNCRHIAKQVHLIHGGVGKRESSTAAVGFTADDYFRLRRKQMEHAFILKYGAVVKGSGWEDTIDQLTSAVIRIELLSTSCSSQVKIDLTPPPDEEVNRVSEAGSGVFIMYNYARLATLLSNFQKAVQDDVYPTLPPVESIDFTCLREEEEWSLFFNYLLPYSAMLQDAVKEIELDSLRPNIHTHKVCQFLHDLSRDLSSYYSRVHILVQGREQLLPVMYARLHLLRAIHDCFKHALQLLGIEPMAQL